MSEEPETGWVRWEGGRYINRPPERATAFYVSVTDLRIEGHFRNEPTICWIVPPEMAEA